MVTKSNLVGGIILLGACALLAEGAQAQTIAAAKASLLAASSSPITVSLTSNPVVTAVVATTATNNTLLLQDNTGAVEAFRVPTTLYTPTIGDTITATAAFTSFHGLFELTTTAPGYTAFSKTGTAALPAQSVFTTTGLQNGSPVGQAQQSTLGTLSGVTITATGTAGTTTFSSGGTYNATDANGTALIFVGTGSPLIGQAVPTSAVNVFGYLGQFDSAATAFGPGAASTNTYEIDPLTISAVTGAAAPEPGALVAMLTGSGILGMAAIRRRKAA